jgi:NADP-dependent 3-hydroxy acid dehydrogenase YdfG
MIVITGASDGLGKALAKLYKDAGKTVVNVSRTASEHADHNILRNLREGDEIKAAATEIEAIDEQLEAIVNCAGVLSIQSLGQIAEDEIKRVMATNVKSQILLVSELINRIKKDKTDIVNVSSTVGTKGYAEQAVYGASKWAVRGFSANLQAEFKDLPNRVISFCPGGFESRIFQKATGAENQDFTHWMDPKDVALCLKQILDLPKNMEVSEIIINRKG